MKFNKRQSKHAEAMRQYHYSKRYGITIRIYDKLLAKQNYCCGVCGCTKNNQGNYFDVDEHPVVHTPRGLLCNKCNRLVGKFEHEIKIDEKFCKKVEKYLDKHD